MAKHITSGLGQWSRRVFSVELDGSSPLYFALQREQQRAPHVLTNTHQNERCYSLLVSGTDRIRDAKLYASLKDRMSKELSSKCEVLRMASFVPHARDSLIKGYFLKDVSDCRLATERVLSDLMRNEPVLVCSYGQEGDGQLSQHLWSRSDGERMGLEQKLYVVPSETPECHPSTLNIINSDVFYSFEEARKVLQECGDIIPETEAVLRLVDQSQAPSQKPDLPVIIIEGLDATGKTTLTQSLREALGATLLRSPPQCLSPWRPLFDGEPALIRRAYYALGNYITAGQIGQEATRKPVIVDRYWHSTAAYAIATAVSGPVCNLPPKGSEVYCWPKDLLQPSMVILLSLDPEERQRRLRDRGQEQTVEEQALDHNRLFRLKVEEAYRRISGPACVTVDASPSADRVLQQVLRLIRDKCLL